MNRTEKEQLATRILITVHQNQGIAWNVASISFTLPAYDKNDVAEGMLWLRDQGYVTRTTSGMIFTTKEGVEYIEGLKENVFFEPGSSALKFNDEALTGVVEVKSAASGFMVSERSKMTTAAVPGPSKHCSKADPESMIIELDEIAKAKSRTAARLKITVDELEGMIVTGRVKLCKKCGVVGIFNKNGENKWRPGCRTCEKG